MSQQYTYCGEVEIKDAGCRLDQVCAQMFPEFSRARLQAWIKSGDILVDNAIAKPKQKVIGGEHIKLVAQNTEQGEWEPEDIALNIVYEDDTIMVINKPAGLVVHPAAGNWDGTLLNGLIFHRPELKSVPRAGIVHRLDKETSGLMVVAKTLQAQVHLVKQLQDRSVSRHYQAITLNEIQQSEGSIDTPIGRHPNQRTKMSVVNVGGKDAITHFEVQKYLRGFTHIHVRLETGRTHQIRVHMAYLGYPLIGDAVYGKSSLSSAIKQGNQHWQAAASFSRQALHAWRLSLIHPDSGEQIGWEVPLPDDMQNLIAELSKD